MKPGSRLSAGPVSGTRLGAIFLIPAILGLLYGSLPIWAQAPSSTPIQSGALTEAETKGPETAEKIWMAHREFLKKGDWEKSQGELEKLYQWKLNQGIRNHYSYASALIREGQQSAREGQSEVTPVILHYAEKMAPDFSQVAYAQAYALWSDLSLENLSRIVGHFLQGVALSLYSLEEALPQFANISLWLLLSFLIALAIFSFFLLFRYFLFYAHHLKHILPEEINPKILTGLGLFLLFLPFFLGLGVMWVFVLWLLVFWSYTNRPDRVVILALLLILLILPTGIRFHSSFLTSLTSNGILEITRANTGVWSADLHRQLLSLKQKNPQDPDILQAVGLVEKRMGKFREAEENFLQWSQVEPKNPAALNNLGNIYLVTNRLGQAVEAYQKAIQLEPSRAEFHYNLGQAYRMNLLLQEAEGEFRKAKELQPELISYSTSISSRHPNRIVVDQPIDVWNLWRRVFEASPEREIATRGYWEFLWNGVPLRYGEMAVVALLAILLVLQKVTQDRPLIRNCERCGRLICSRCSHSVVMGSRCSQCIGAFTTRAEADPREVKQKKTQIADYQARRLSLPKWFSWILPGGGHLLVGRSQEGFLYLFIFVLFVTKILLWNEWVPSPLVLEIRLYLPGLILTGFLFLVYYVFVQYRMVRFLARGVKFNFRTA